MGNTNGAEQKQAFSPLVRPLVEDVHWKHLYGDGTTLPRLPIKRTRSAPKTKRELHVQKISDLQRKTTWKKPDYYNPAMIPEPDYSDSEPEDPLQRSERRHNGQHKMQQQPGGPRTNQQQNKGQNSSNGSSQFTEDGLIIPKKIPNPCLNSTERQSLHRELRFNQKVGKNVLGQKSELQKAMEKFKEDQKRKELEEERVNKRSSFEKRLEEQASKIKTLEEEPKKGEESIKDQPEFLRVHARVRALNLPVDT